MRTCTKNLCCKVANSYLSEEDARAYVREGRDSYRGVCGSDKSQEDEEVENVFCSVFDGHHDFADALDRFRGFEDQACVFCGVRDETAICVRISPRCALCLACVPRIPCCSVCDVMQGAWPGACE